MPCARFVHHMKRIAHRGRRGQAQAAFEQRRRMTVPEQIGLRRARKFQSFRLSRRPAPERRFRSAGASEPDRPRRPAAFGWRSVGTALQTKKSWRTRDRCPSNSAGSPAATAGPRPVRREAHRAAPPCVWRAESGDGRAHEAVAGTFEWQSERSRTGALRPNSIRSLLLARPCGTKASVGNCAELEGRPS